MSKGEFLRRFLLYFISVFFIGLGIAFAKRCDLGIAPISSFPNVLSIKFSALTIGNWLIVENCVFVLIQILVLRKKFKPFQLLQLPLSFIFGYFTDLGMWITTLIVPESYLMKLLCLIAGIIILGLGVSIGVIAAVIMNPGEAIVKVLSDATGIKFGNMKIIVDSSCVVIATVFSLIFFHGKLVGIREGTVITMLLVGTAVKLIKPIITKPIVKLFALKSEKV